MSWNILYRWVYAIHRVGVKALKAFKRKILTAFVALAVLCTASHALAADTSIELKDLNLKLSIPDGWCTVTRDTPSSDPVFTQIGSSGDDFLTYMNQHSIYLDALNLTDVSEIVVSKVENSDINSLYNLSLLTDAQRDTFAQQLMNSQSAKDAGITYTGYSIYSHPQVKFVVMDLVKSVNGVTSYGRQYMTVVNGSMISITMHSYENVMTADQQAQCKAIVDSASFTKISSKPLSFGDINKCLRPLCGYRGRACGRCDRRAACSKEQEKEEGRRPSAGRA